MMDALFYAKLAQRAYFTPPTFGAEDSACRAISTITQDGLAISFPGTNNAATVLADIEVDVLDVDGFGALHEGFWRAYFVQRPKLLALSPKVVCGHSEGAALALIYAADLCLHGKKPAAIYAFEPPRISADSTLAELFEHHQPEMLLTRNGEDPVTGMPCLLHNWQQPWALTHIGQDSILDAIQDHLIENVIRSLQTIEETA